MKKELGIFSLLVVVCGVTEILNPQFLKGTNLTNLANLIGMFGVFSIGMGLVIITGGIDLSVGSMFALTGVLMSLALMEWHWPWIIVAAGGIGLPMVLGWCHGRLITGLKLQPFIVTLCGLLLYRGIARYIAKDATVGYGDADDAGSFEILRSMASGHLFKVPMPFVILVVVSIVMWFLLHRSVYGRQLLAVGGNEEGARFSGINTRRVITTAYVIAGALTGISGIMFAFFTNSVSPSTHGNFFELYAIAAAVLGGCSLRGGQGSIVGIVIGTALLQVLKNLINLARIDSSLEYAVIGAVVLVGVVADQIFQKRSVKKLAKH